MKPGPEMKHAFVDFIPDKMESGVLYVTMEFATASHLCCCGCGSEVVTPISPTDWQLSFDGRSVSLKPSIGNWSFPCQSHYWITNGRVRWALPMSREEIEAGRALDRFRKSRFFGVDENLHREEDARKTAVVPQRVDPLRRVWEWWQRR